MIKISAQWHKTCTLKFNDKEFKQANKRKAKLDIENENGSSYESSKFKKEKYGYSKSPGMFFSGLKKAPQGKTSTKHESSGMCTFTRRHGSYP